MRTSLTLRARLLSLAAAAALLAPALGAQVAVPSGVVASPGEVVRVRTDGWLYTGTLGRVTLDSATVLIHADSVRIPRTSVVRLQVQRGTRRSAGRVILGAAVGLVAGGVVGGFTGVGLECGMSCDDDGEWAGIGGAILGTGIGSIAGAITGGVIGGKKRVPRWVPAVLPAAAP